MTPNSRNGKSKKTVVSEYGEQEIAVPRDRMGEFEPVDVQKHQKNVTGIEDQIIALYAKGPAHERFKTICKTCTGSKSRLRSFPMLPTKSCL
ncbi:transposase [Paenibacillus sp. p3-SID867]|nr:transposase [Paenibacillus sp. p3-SID867]MCT1398554.1 transposase [Paenibacillus sp. p3-SID867]